MQFTTSLVLLAGAGLASAQMNMTRPMNTSICDYYTTALLKNNSAANQYKVLQLVVNTALIGNYTSNPGSLNAVPGILAPGMYDGQEVKLAPYFTGALASTNRNGTATSVNFLDGGGAAPIKAGQLPAKGSNELKLAAHLYSYFGALLKCSGYGTADFPAYAGSGNQYNVHKFMVLNNAEVGYFIQQVGLSATSFGVSQADATAVGKQLGQVFNYKCSPPATVIPMQGNQTQSICAANSCPLDPMQMCSAYPMNGAAYAMPANTTGGATSAMNGTSTDGPGNGGNGNTGTGSGSSSSPSPSSTGNAAAINGVSFGAVAAGALAMFAL